MPDCIGTMWWLVNEQAGTLQCTPKSAAVQGQDADAAGYAFAAT